MNEFSMPTYTYDQLKTILDTQLNIGYPASSDMGDKVALFALVGNLTNALKQKKPDVTHYKVLRMCTKDQPVDDQMLMVIALISEWFSWNCTKFPDLGMKPKEMPAKIAQLIHDMLPF